MDLVINGEHASLTSDSKTTLLTALRDELGLVGTRFGCGQGLCGACFVNVEGTVMAACQTPLSQVEGQSVTTVEGLSQQGVPHRVQRALIEGQAAQCAFCISGIVMTAAALLDREPQANRDRVVDALDRHLCRCGAQRRIIEAVLAARDAGP